MVRICNAILAFGAGAGTATLFSLMGMDYLILNRIDDRLKYVSSVVLFVTRLEI